MEVLMTPDDIRSQRFAVRLVRGFNPEEVSAFLLDVADAYEDLEMVNASLTQHVKTLEAELEACSGRPISPAPSTTKLADGEPAAESAAHAGRRREAAASGPTETLRAAALREIEALLHDAQTRAETIVAGAKEREAALLKDAEGAKARLQAEADSLLAGAAAKADALMADARDQEATARAEIERLSERRVQLVDDIRGVLDTHHQWLATIDPRGPRQGRGDRKPSNAGSPNEPRTG
jgi:DivIVA domain-containing protein